MLLSTLSIRRTLAGLAGRTTGIGDVLRFSSSSPLNQPSPRDPPPHPSSQGVSCNPTSATPPPPLLNHKTTTTSSSLPSPQRDPIQRSPHHKPTLEPSPLPRHTRSPYQRTSTPYITSSSFLSVLRDREKNPSSPRAASADLVALVAGEASLVVIGSKEETEELVRRLMETASSLEGGVDVASWILRVTEERQRDRELRYLVYRIAQELNELAMRLRPRPKPDPLLHFLLANQARLRLSSNNPNLNPLFGLLEVYTRLYTQDRRRLDPSAVTPPPNALVHLESLRFQHLDAVRAIHQAMKEVDKDVFTVRSYTSLMDAYNQGRSFQEGDEIWELMRSEGGVGIDQRSVSVYFDACGFNGSLPRALATWKDLQTTGFTLDENNYHAYIECLNRCGAWDELLDHLSEQQAQHLVDSTTTPPLTVPALAATLGLANRMVMQPRHRSLRQVNWEDFKRLRSAIKGLVPKETWEETERLLKRGERFVISLSPKTGNGRRPDRERPQ